MEKFKRAKLLFRKYLDRTATESELEELFRLFEDRGQFESVYELFEREWESKDVEWDLNHLTLQSVREKYQRHNPSKRETDKYTKNWLWWGSGIAAGMAALIGFFFWYLGGDHQVIYETGYGETLEVVLEDQSVVKLNANSRLTWHSDWEKTGVRKLELEGEAFFTVKTIPADENSGIDHVGERLPFQVVTPDLTVNVHGTVFNVEARRQKTNVFLESGVVELELNTEVVDGERSSTTNRSGSELTLKPEKILMKPGDAVSYSVSQKLLEQAGNGTTQDNASWTEGSLYFENERLEEVLNQLEDIYGKEFEVTDTALLHRNVDLGLPFEDWNTVSGLMSLTLEMEMKEVDGKIILDRMQN